MYQLSSLSVLLDYDRLKLMDFTSASQLALHGRNYSKKGIWFITLVLHSSAIVINGDVLDLNNRVRS